MALSPWIPWPDEPIPSVAPVRVGMDRSTFGIKIGWDHTEQSVNTILVTRFHERPGRRWVGSFVPHLLGKSGTMRTIARFWWAILSAIHLQEPNYRIIRVYATQGDKEGEVLRRLTTVEDFRLGTIAFQSEGQHRPRAHLGDPTPEAQRGAGLSGATAAWEYLR